MWVREFHVDALRLDAIHAIVDQSARPFLAELAGAVHAAADELGRTVLLIAENNRNDPRIFQPPATGGCALDAQWLDDFGRALQGLLTGERNGFYADFGSVDDLAKAWRSGYVLSGQHSNYRRRRHGAESDQVPCERFFAYAQTHDQVGNRPRSDRLSTIVEFDQLKLAAAAMLLSPYQPLLFMGEEYGETAPFHYFISHLDRELVERVRAGRHREFAAFRWESEPADPQAESTFSASKLDRTRCHTERHGVLWNYYRELLALRRELVPLGEPTRAGSRVESSEQPAMLLSTRHDESIEVAILLHFSAQAIVLPPAQLLAGGTWTRRFDSCDPRWQSAGSPAPVRFEPADGLTLGPWAAVVYQRDR
jgi:maltooligosyltrehalose trehalohydrolase